MIALVEKTMGQARAEALSKFMRTTAHRQEARVKSQFKTALPFLGGSIALGLLLMMIATHTVCYTVSIGNAKLAYAGQPEVIEQAVSSVEEEVGVILGRDYEMTADVSYRLSVANKNDVQGYTSLNETLYSMIPEIKSAYLLKVDGITVGTARDVAELEAVMDSIAQAYTTENTTAVEVLNTVDMEEAYVPFTQAYETKDDILNIMSASAKTMAVTMDSREVATVSQDALPLIHVNTIERAEYTEIVESPVREIKDSTLYEGESEIIIKGTAGENFVVADVTKLNGEETARAILSEEVIVEPTETVMAIGTLTRPIYYSTGTLDMPCTGLITSNFGYRNIFGSTSFHSGVDIAGQSGDAICASDSGIVKSVGYQGTYGNLVVIDHGNGWVTYYAHCNSILVSEGDCVKQGMQIATMGATGRATGVHCHWELRVNGEQVNPLSYI